MSEHNYRQDIFKVDQTFVLMEDIPKVGQTLAPMAEAKQVWAGPARQAMKTSRYFCNSPWEVFLP